MNKHQLERVVIKWLNKHYGNLTPKKHKYHSQLVFYVNSDNGVMMEYDQKNEGVYIHYGHIWSKIESLFHLNYGETQSIMKVWVEEAYKLGGVTPMTGNITSYNSGGRGLQIGGSNTRKQQNK
jgi:hypothetical protein